MLCAAGAMAESTSCYWPNGKATTDDYVPCPDGKQCCVKGESCLSNGLCFRSTDATLYRGGCSDKSWPIADCTNVCFEGEPLSVGNSPGTVLTIYIFMNTELDDKWANLWRCNNSEKYTFTCGNLGAPTTCKENLSTYDWKESDATNVTVAQLGVENVSGPIVTVHSGTGVYSPDNSKKKLGIGLGVGLGVPMILAVASLLWFYLKTQKQIRHLQERLLDEQQRPQTSGPGLQIMRELGTGESASSELQSNPRSELPS